jgi:AraC-like DNA-binding protein
MGIQYAEHAPSDALTDVVRCYWSVTDDGSGPAGPVRNRILPDNCIDVIFDLRDPHGRGFLVGPMLTAEVFDQAPAARMIGVRFRPGAATSFVDVTATELQRAHVDAADVWRDTSSLCDQLGSVSRDEAIRALDAYLRRIRRDRPNAILASTATALIERAHGALSVGALVTALGVNERRLQRVFDDAVGIGPKQVARVTRFRTAVRKVSADRAASLSRIAAETGYADQAHFTRDFVALAGITPTEFRAERRLVGFIQD